MRKEDIIKDELMQAAMTVMPLAQDYDFTAKLISGTGTPNPGIMNQTTNNPFMTKILYRTGFKQ